MKMVTLWIKFLEIRWKGVKNEWNRTQKNVRVGVKKIRSLACWDDTKIEENRCWQNVAVETYGKKIDWTLEFKILGRKVTWEFFVEKNGIWIKRIKKIAKDKLDLGKIRMFNYRKKIQDNVLAKYI